MNPYKQKGFSLVELMVSITIGLILLAGVVSIFFSSRVTFSTNERQAKLQEDGRVALDLVVHDIRSAGYTGCSRGIQYDNNLNNPTALLWNYEGALQGYESDGAGGFNPALGITLTPAPVNDSDVIVVRAAKRDGRNTKLVTDLVSLSSNPSVTNTGPIDAGTVYMIGNCQNADFFQVTSWTTGSPNGTITHTTAPGTPGNAKADFSFLYRAGARLVPLETVIYYVGIDATSGEPGLFRQIGSAAPQLLIEGVQALQLSYGEDTATIQQGDRVADIYRSASDVALWHRVISVNVSLLIRSTEWGTNSDTNTYTLLTTAVGGKTLGPYNDRRQRMMFTTTAALRNRAW